MNVQPTFEECARVLRDSAASLSEPLAGAIDLCRESLDGGGTILTCGNGGSAADAQHLTAELVCRYRTDRKALASIALTANSSSITAIGNDFGFDRTFSRQVEALAKKGDVLVTISTSGESINVVEAARVARTSGCRVVALTGETGGSLAQHADVVLAVPSPVLARIQEIHGICIHILAEALEEAARDKPDTAAPGEAK